MNYYMDSLIETKKDLFAKEIIKARIMEDRFIEYEIKYFLKIAQIETFKEDLCLAVIKSEENLYYFDNSFLSVNEFISKFFSKNFKFMLVPCFDNFILIAQMFKSNRFNYFINELEKLCREFENKFNSKLSVGVANNFTHVENLKSDYKSATDMLRYRALHGSGNVFYSEDYKIQKSLNFDKIEGEFLEKSIKNKSIKDIENSLNKIFSQIDIDRVLFNDYKLYLIEIINFIINVIRQENIKIEKVFGESLKIHENIEEWDSIFSAYKWIKEKAIITSNLIDIQRFTTTKVLLKQAKYFIEKNYTDSNLSVKSISKELHISSTYLSTIFKKEMNTSIIAYITKLRLDKAKKLLKSTNRTACNIAELVGYSDSNYFSYVFKKEFGISPSKYRIKR